MDAQTGRTITRSSQAGAAVTGTPSASGVPRTGPAVWPREASGLRIPRHHAGCCGAQQWMLTDTLR